MAADTDGDLCFSFNKIIETAISIMQHNVIFVKKIFIITAESKSSGSM